MQELIEVKPPSRLVPAARKRTTLEPPNATAPSHRLLATRAGDIELRIPNLRKGSFFPSILEPCRRIDQAVYRS